MTSIRKISIALTSDQIAVLKVATNGGAYATTSEVIREAIRDWQRKNKAFLNELRRKRPSRKRRTKVKSRSKKKSHKKRRNRR